MADKTFGDNLSKSRKKAGLSQEELAEKMGLTRQTISKWETGASVLWLPGGDVYYGRLCPHGESNQHRDIPSKHYNRSTGDDADPCGDIFCYGRGAHSGQKEAKPKLTIFPLCRALTRDMKTAMIIAIS